MGSASVTTAHPTVRFLLQRGDEHKTTATIRPKAVATSVVPPPTSSVFRSKVPLI